MFRNIEEEKEEKNKFTKWVNIGLNSFKSGLISRTNLASAQRPASSNNCK